MDIRQIILAVDNQKIYLPKNPTVQAALKFSLYGSTKNIDLSQSTFTIDKSISVLLAF